RRSLAQVRLAIGIGALVAPRVTGRLFGIDVAANPAAPYLARLFGARELFMAAPFLMPAPGLDEAELASRAVPVDAADAMASLVGGLRGYLPWRAAVPATAAGLLGTWLGSQAAKNEKLIHPT
ncbi:MAG TPA: hypothetical protein DCS55_18045, partial [Acidimicrobiaceae bacterium]|nr:hypothetical protein [Acidimicrobiaceae bacterium]